MINSLDLVSKCLGFACLESGQEGAETGPQRMVALATPFLALHPATSPLAPLGTAACDVMQHKEDRLTRLVLAVSNAAFRALFPTAHMTLSTALFVITRISKVLEHLKNRQWMASSLECLQMVSQMLLLAARYSGNRLLRAAAFALQGLMSLYQVAGAKQFPEKLVEALLGMLRLYLAGLAYASHVSRPKQPDLVLCITSPSDSNGAMRHIRKSIVNPASEYHHIVHTSPRNLDELEETFGRIHKQQYRVSTVLFNCHGCPLAVKPTNFLIQVPLNEQQATDFWRMQSAGQRVPAPHEYESFDRFVAILHKGVVPNGKVTFLSCSTAAAVRYPEGNLTDAIARRLPGIEVSGSAEDFPPRQELALTRSAEVVMGDCFKRYVYQPESTSSGLGTVSCVDLS